MAETPAILRQLQLHAQPRKIGRAARAPASAADGAPTAGQAPLADQAAFDRGYQQGLEQARREAEQREAQATHSMQAATRAREAQDAATQQAQARAQMQAQVHAQTQAQELNASLTRLQELLDTLRAKLPEQMHACLQDAEDDMLELVYEVVCRVLGESVASLDGLRAQLQSTLKAWHGRAPLSLHLHPDDLALLQADATTAEFLRASGFSAERASLRWVADPEVTLGGCMLRTSEGALDARLEVQLQALKASLVTTRASRRHLAALPPALPVTPPTALPAGEPPP